MRLLGVIGGAGLANLPELRITRREVVHTPYGEPSGPLVYGRLAGHEMLFLARHGFRQRIPPHQINYRANVWALNHLGADCVISAASVRGVTEEAAPGRLLVPDQIIDYTHGREHTFFEEDRRRKAVQIDFAYPYDDDLRRRLVAAGRESGLSMVDGGTYGATQGPRLETVAEVERMKRDGCDILGMTGMPEAVLARELGLPYAACTVISRRAAGQGAQPPAPDRVAETLREGMEQVGRLLENCISCLD